MYKKYLLNNYKKLSMKEIAKELNMTESVARRILKKLGIKRKPRVVSSENIKKWVCIDCGNSVFYRSKRCEPCDYKARSNRLSKGNFKKGGIPWNKGVSGSSYNKGKANPNWKDGMSSEPYPYEFTQKTFKKKIRDRDNNICQICGKTKKEEKRNMRIHHINYNKKDLDPFNLISLCINCHGKTGYNRESWEDFLMDLMAFRYMTEVMEVA